MKEAGQLYLSIEKGDSHYDLEQIVQWLETMETNED